MSKLRVSAVSQSFELNCTSFSSPIYDTINSVQTRKMAIHFPIKTNQPQVQFDVQFASERDFEAFQRFVRTHQQAAVMGTLLATFNWPERDIQNWTGVIRSFVAGGQRANYAPRASFVVDLVDSLVSRRTYVSSIGAPWQTIYGGFGLPGMILTSPSVAEVQSWQQLLSEYGTNEPVAIPSGTP